MTSEPPKKARNQTPDPDYRSQLEETLQVNRERRDYWQAILDDKPKDWIAENNRNVFQSHCDNLERKIRELDTENEGKNAN